MQVWAVLGAWSCRRHPSGWDLVADITHSPGESAVQCSAGQCSAVYRVQWTTCRVQRASYKAELITDQLPCREEWRREWRMKEGGREAGGRHSTMVQVVCSLHMQPIEQCLLKGGFLWCQAWKFSKRWTMNIELCTYTVHCTLYTVHCTLYPVPCTLYTVHCTMYIKFHSKNKAIRNTKTNNKIEQLGRRSKLCLEYVKKMH